MINEKQIAEMARDISEATRRASKILVDEAKAFIKENHRYHSKNDFRKAHTKTMSELEAEYLTAKGYRKQAWISVEERLPTEQDVGDDCGVIAIHKRSAKRYFHWRSVADNPFDFTHWMPLPEPPKGEEQ